MHRGELTPELTRAPEQQVKPDVLTALTVHYEEVSGQEVEVIEEEQLMPQDLWPRHSDEEAHKLVQIQQGKGRSLADLINLATRLKQPAPTTLKEWNAVVKSLISISKTDQIESITDDHARAYRKVQPPLGDVALLGTNPLRIYVMLFEAAQHDVRGDCGGTSSWSIKGLASELHIKRETASRALNKLLDCGFIQIAGEEENKGNSRNTIWRITYPSMLDAVRYSIEIMGKPSKRLQKMRVKNKKVNVSKYSETQSLQWL